MNERDGQRETVGFEIVIRFYPGAESEAYEFFNRLGWPDEQCDWVHLYRVVVPEGEDRVRESARSRVR